jgi:hypothetical protein
MGKPVIVAGEAARAGGKRKREKTSFHFPVFSPNLHKDAATGPTAISGSPSD